MPSAVGCVPWPACGIVLEAVLAFVFDRLVPAFASCLVRNRRPGPEVSNHAVEDGVVVVALGHVVEVGNRLGAFLRQFGSHNAHVGSNQNGHDIPNSELLFAAAKISTHFTARRAGLNQDGNDRNILCPAVVDQDALDFVDHPARRPCRIRCSQKLSAPDSRDWCFRHVDEELRGGQFSSRCAPWRSSKARFRPFLASFWTGLLVFSAPSWHPSAADHEAVDHAVENGAFVKAALDVRRKLAGLGRLFLVNSTTISPMLVLIDTCGGSAARTAALR